MPDSDWCTAKIADIAAPGPRSIAIGPFGSALKANVYSDAGVPVVRGQDLTDRKEIAADGRVFVPPEVAAKFPACLVRHGDLVFPHRGAIGRVGIVGEEEMLLSTSMMKLTVDRTLMDPLFVFYYFRGSGRQELLARASTVGTPGIGQPLTSLRSIPISFPSLRKQHAIAEVLGSLDNKIAANDRTLAVSDELVRARFEKLAGELVPLCQVGSVIHQQTAPAAVEPTTPYVGLEHIPRRRMWLSDSACAADISSAKSAFRAGDVLFGKLRPYFHKVVWAPFAGICSTDVLVMRAVDAALAGFLLAAASADGTIQVVTASAKGTRMPRTSWSDVGSVLVPWPGTSAARSFSAEVASLAEQSCQLAWETNVLSRVRDELLPLVMSGKVRVRDAEELMGGAG